MDSNVLTAIAATLAALIGGSGAVIVSLLTRKKMLSESKAKDSESAALIEDAATSLVAVYKADSVHVRLQYEELELSMKECVKEIKELKAKLQGFETRHANLLDVIERLVHQIKSLNHAPVCGPEIIGEME